MMSHFYLLLSLVALTSSYRYARPPQTLVFGLSHQMQGIREVIRSLVHYLSDRFYPLLGFKFECPLLRF